MCGFVLFSSAQRIGYIYMYLLILFPVLVPNADVTVNRNSRKKQHLGTLMNFILRWLKRRQLMEFIDLSKIWIFGVEFCYFLLFCLVLKFISLFLFKGVKQINILQKSSCWWKLKIWPTFCRNSKVRKRLDPTYQNFILGKAVLHVFMLLEFVLGTENWKAYCSAALSWWAASIKGTCILCRGQVNTYGHIAFSNTIM